MFMDAGLKFLIEAKLGGEQARVLFALLICADWDGEIFAERKQIAEWCNIPVSNVSRSIAALRKKAIIFPTRRIGNNQCYRINASLFWRGNVKEMFKHRFTQPAEHEIDGVEGLEECSAPWPLRKVRSR